MSFTHLHVHSDYSILDSIAKVEDIVKKAKDLGMSAIALTDHGVAYGLVDFFDVCQKYNIKPILGCEVYEATESRFDKTSEKSDDRYYHLVLLVKNDIGYKNLCHLISKSNTEGFYYKPRIDLNLLEKYHEGLICLSACIGGRVQRLILNGEEKKAREAVLKYKSIFGDNYYLEIQNHGLREEAIVSDTFIRFSRELGVKIVCTNDCHYVNTEDEEAHDWQICLQRNEKIDDPGAKIYNGDYSILSEEEMRKKFPSLQEAFDNTEEIVEKCNFEFRYGNYRMPTVTIPKEFGNDFYGYLESEAKAGFEQRYPANYPNRKLVKERLESELSVIKQMGFAEYFLDTRKTILWAREHGIYVGPGRGSAAGSVMCYSLKITDIDPIEYDLLFERFLNPERISMPDIDVDYDYSHKDEVIKFEAESNGYDKFAKIQTFGTMLAKGILRDCVRVAGLPVYVGDKFSSMIPKDPKITLREAYDQNPEIAVYIKENGYEKIWNMALKLEGVKKSVGTHACGHIPTPVPCEDLFPVSVDSESGMLVCQYNMTEAEHLGNLKKDLLMLRNLTIIDIAQKQVKKRYGIDVPLWTEDILNDKKALELISSGDTNGIFQLESDGMKAFMKELKPTCFEDVIAGVALYRPGPMDYIPEYIKGKKNPEKIKYLVPELEEILSPTYGIIVYQEQVMLIVQKLAGFSMGRADVVRRAMGKKKMDIMEAERKHFVYGSDELHIPGCVNNGILEDVANKIYDQMVDFAKYAFNKSHAACYAAISMQTAYLKANYTLEFAAGLLTSVTDKTEKLSIYVNEYRKKGVVILPPDLNSSEENFSVVDEALCYGLSSVKGIGKDVVVEVLNERNKNEDFIDFEDFIVRCSFLKKNVIEAFIKVGALDFTGLTRRTMLENKDRLLQGIKKEGKSQVSGQMSLSDFLAGQKESFSLSVKEFPEYNKAELLQMEKEVAGFYVSGHPMDEFQYVGAESIPLSGLFLENGDCRYSQGIELYVSGMITDIDVKYSKKTGRAMGFLTIEDQTGVIGITLFPDIYDRYRHQIEIGQPVRILGKVNIYNGSCSILPEKIYNLEFWERDVWIDVRGQESVDFQKLESFKDLRKGSGNYIIVRTTDGIYNLGEVCMTDKSFRLLKDFFGEEKVKTAGRDVLWKFMRSSKGSL